MTSPVVSPYQNFKASVSCANNKTMKFINVFLASFVLLSGLVSCTEPDKGFLVKLKEYYTLFMNSFSITKVQEEMDLEKLIELENVNFGLALGMVTCGLFIALMGLRLFKPFLVISGFAVGGSLSVYTYVSFITIFSKEEWVFYVFVGVSGILGSVCFTNAWEFGSYVLSAVGGVQLGFLIIAVSDTLSKLLSVSNYLENVNPNLLIGIFAIIGLILAKYIRDTAVICTSALIGAFLAFIGVDCLKDVGFRAFLYKTIKGIPIENLKINSDSQDSGLYDQHIKNLIGKIQNEEYFPCIIGVIFVTIFGICFQFQNKPKKSSSDDF